MIRVTWRRELAMAVGLMGLSVILGLMFQWPLVHGSLKGNLTTLLDQKRQERREVQFQGVKTLDLAQAYRTWPAQKALFVDARKAEEYQELHIQGAVNVPPETWGELASAELILIVAAACFSSARLDRRPSSRMEFCSC